MFNGQDRGPEMTAKELKLYNTYETHTSILIILFMFSVFP